MPPKREVSDGKKIISYLNSQIRTRRTFRQVQKESIVKTWEDTRNVTRQASLQDQGPIWLCIRQIWQYSWTTYQKTARYLMVDYFKSLREYDKKKNERVRTSCIQSIPCSKQMVLVLWKSLCGHTKPSNNYVPAICSMTVGWSRHQT